MANKILKANLVSLYIKEKYKPIYKRFKELVARDPVYLRKQTKTNSGLMSAAIWDMIVTYVQEKDPDFIIQLASTHVANMEVDDEAD